MLYTASTATYIRRRFSTKLQCISPFWTAFAFPWENMKVPSHVGSYMYVVCIDCCMYVRRRSSVMLVEVHRNVSSNICSSSGWTLADQNLSRLIPSNTVPEVFQRKRARGWPAKKAATGVNALPRPPLLSENPQGGYVWTEFLHFPIYSSHGSRE